MDASTFFRAPSRHRPRAAVWRTCRLMQVDDVDLLPPGDVSARIRRSAKLQTRARDDEQRSGFSLFFDRLAGAMESSSCARFKPERRRAFERLRRVGETLRERAVKARVSVDKIVFVPNDLITRAHAAVRDGRLHCDAVRQRARAATRDPRTGRDPRDMRQAWRRDSVTAPAGV